MTMTTMLLALIAWLLISCAIAWGVGRASDLGQAEESEARSGLADERRQRSDRRLGADRRQTVDRRSSAREGYERRVMDRRLLQRRLTWAT